MLYHNLMKRKRRRVKTGYVESYADVNIFSRGTGADRIKSRFKYGAAMAAIILLCLILFFIVFGASAKVKLSRNLTAEINSHLLASSFVERIEDGGHISRDQAVDTSTLGKKLCKITVTINGKEKDYEFRITVVDTEAPIIGAEDNITVIAGTEVDIISQGRITDNSGETPSIKTSGSWDIDKPGDYPVELTAQDESGNKIKKEIVISVIDANQTGDFSFTTGKGFKANRTSGILYVDGIIVVNKSFNLPRNYEPGFRDEAYYAFYEMVEQAEEEDISIWAISDYRSWEGQRLLYEEYKEKEPDRVDNLCSRAGHSEHQTGLALDINHMEEGFDGEAEGKWLNDHCWEHGFIIRYPRGKEDVTGYQGEPWHIRYVGKELASKLYNNGDWITIEEYFGLPSVYAD